MKTPAFDRVAREEFLFSHAYTPSAKCAPARASIITGRNPWQLKEAANHICYFPLEFKSWGEALAEHGWTVGYTMKGWAPGVALAADGKPRLLTGVAFNQHKLTPPTTEISNDDYAANFASFLDQTAAGKPWCCWARSRSSRIARTLRLGRGQRREKLTTSTASPAAGPTTTSSATTSSTTPSRPNRFDRHLGKSAGGTGKARAPRQYPRGGDQR